MIVAYMGPTIALRTSFVKRKVSTDQVDGTRARLRKRFLSRNNSDRKPKASVDSKDVVFHINLADNRSEAREDISLFT